jgi:plastocyanin
VVPGTWTSALLTGMLGWQPQPTEAEVIGYFLYLVPATLYVLWPAQLGTRVARTASTTTLLLLLVLALAACGSSGGEEAGNSKQVEVKLTDAGCSPATLKLDAGRTTFKVTNAGTGRVSELEVLKGSRILGEKENLVAGLSGSFTITLQPGQYTLSCPGGTTAATGVVTVGGKRVAGITDPRLQAAVTGYRGYVHGQAELLVKRVRPFVAAVKAGDVAAAKRQFAAARAPYETKWIARFNRRRKRLEGVGFLSGQALGLGILGLTSVYREGFETVLFVQNLEVSAGAAACLLGAAMPSSPTGFTVPLWASRWLGIYATWEGIACQLGALVFVVGSYVVARELQSPQRRSHRLAAARQ